MRALVLAVLVMACGKEAPEQPPPAIGADEIHRGQEACKIYVEKLCACADKLPALKKDCEGARPMPEALELSIGFASAPDTKRSDVASAQNGVRQIIKDCIEQTAKLPGKGCP